MDSQLDERERFVSFCESFVPPFSAAVRTAKPVTESLGDRPEVTEWVTASLRLSAVIETELEKIENPDDGELIDLAAYLQARTWRRHS